MSKLTMADVKRINKEKGNFFFSNDTMRAFGSIIESELLVGNYFITSENNFNGTKRMFTVRQFNEETGDIKTIGGFNHFFTRDGAMEYIDRLRIPKKSTTIISNEELLKGGYDFYDKQDTEIS